MRSSHSEKWISNTIVMLLLASILSSLPAKAGREDVLPEDSVTKTLIRLGEPEPRHLMEWDDFAAYAEKGRELFFQGRTTDFEGNLTPIQSEHFRCTDCHTTNREDPLLTDSNPETRAAYVQARNMPFLPGTTLFGTVNKSSWYNEDYTIKYGDLVRNARFNLRNAIQVCSTACSAGRRMESWELKAVLAYLWTQEYRLTDLDLSASELNIIQNALAGNGDPQAAATLIKSKFRSFSPANFGATPDSLRDGYPLSGDPVKGRFIYTSSCLYCHGNRTGAPMRDTLDMSWSTYSYLIEEIESDASIYNMIRHGTTQDNRAYMPQYPLERMSNQQVEDLRAFIQGELWLGIGYEAELGSSL